MKEAQEVFDLNSAELDELKKLFDAPIKDNAIAFLCDL